MRIRKNEQYFSKSAKLQTIFLDPRQRLPPSEHFSQLVHPVDPLCFALVPVLFLLLQHRFEHLMREKPLN